MSRLIFLAYAFGRSRGSGKSKKKITSAARPGPCNIQNAAVARDPRFRRSPRSGTIMADDDDACTAAFAFRVPSDPRGPPIYFFFCSPKGFIFPSVDFAAFGFFARDACGGYRNMTSAPHPPYERGRRRRVAQMALCRRPWRKQKRRPKTGVAIVPLFHDDIVIIIYSFPRRRRRQRPPLFSQTVFRWRATMKKKKKKI